MRILGSLVCAVALTGCSLYFGEDDDAPVPGDDTPDPGPGGTTHVIERPCLHAVVGGRLLTNGPGDELFVSSRCEASEGSFMYVLVENGGVPITQHETAPDLRFAYFGETFRGLRLVSRPGWGTGLMSIAMMETGAWRFFNANGESIGVERPYSDLALPDLDDDGTHEWLLVGDNAIRRAPPDPIGHTVTIADETELLTGMPFASAVAAQLGGSPATDLMFVTTTGDVGFALQTTPGKFEVTATFPDPGAAPQPLITADVDGDGIEDVIGAAGHLFVRSSKTGTLSFLTEPVRAFTVGDLDGDGTAEPVYITADGTTVRRVTVTATGSLTTQLAYAGGGDALAIADLDDDKRGDLALIRDRDKPSSRLVIKLSSKPD